MLALSFCSCRDGSGPRGPAAEPSGALNSFDCPGALKEERSAGHGNSRRRPGLLIASHLMCGDLTDENPRTCAEWRRKRISLHGLHAPSPEMPKRSWIIRMGRNMNGVFPHRRTVTARTRARQGMRWARQRRFCYNSGIVHRPKPLL